MFECRTVGELKEALVNFADDRPLKSKGADSGGYDWAWTDTIIVDIHESERPLLVYGKDDNDV